MPVIMIITCLLLYSYHAYFHDHTMPIIMIVLCLSSLSYYPFYCDHIMSIIMEPYNRHNDMNPIIGIRIGIGKGILE